MLFSRGRTARPPGRPGHEAVRLGWVERAALRPTRRLREFRDRRLAAGEGSVPSDLWTAPPRAARR